MPDFRLSGQKSSNLPDIRRLPDIRYPAKKMSAPTLLKIPLKLYLCRFEADDLELQDEPLQVRIMDYDAYSANDAIGKVSC